MSDWQAPGDEQADNPPEGAGRAWSPEADFLQGKIVCIVALVLTIGLCALADHFQDEVRAAVPMWVENTLCVVAALAVFGISWLGTRWAFRKFRS